MNSYSYTVFTSKSLGGLVVEKTSVIGVHRGILRTNGTAVVYFKSSNGKKFLVSSTGKKAIKWVHELLDEAKGAFALCDAGQDEA